MARVSGSEGLGIRVAWLTTEIGLDRLPSKWDPCSRSEAVYGQYGDIQGCTIQSRCYTGLEGVARLGHEGMSMVSPRFLPEAWRARGAPGCAVMEVSCSRSLDLLVWLV